MEIANTKNKKTYAGSAMKKSTEKAKDVKTRPSSARSDLRMRFRRKTDS
jgi:hypothetical protein